MRTCAKCKHVNIVDTGPCSACGAPLDHAPPAAGPEEDVFARDRARRRLRAIIGAVVLVAGAAGILWYSAKNRQKAVDIEAILTPYNKLNRETLGEFWYCLMRCDPRTGKLSGIKDNAALERAIEGAWEKGRQTYGKHIQEKCVPKLAEVPKLIAAVPPTGGIGDALANYGQAVELVASATRRYGEAVDRAANSKESKRIQTGADAFHRLAMGEEAPDGFGYEGFLRCSADNFDSLDPDAWLLYVFQSCKKDPRAFAAKLRGCAASMTATKASPAFAGVVKKWGEDVRDVDALADCFTRANKAERTALMEDISKGWLEYMKANDDLLQAIKALKE